MRQSHNISNTPVSAIHNQLMHRTGCWGSRDVRQDLPQVEGGELQVGRDSLERAFLAIFPKANVLTNKVQGQLRFSICNRDGQENMVAWHAPFLQGKQGFTASYLSSLERSILCLSAVVGISSW